MKRSLLVADEQRELGANVTADAALRVQGLSKTFGEKRAVHNVDLRVPRGSFYGLVGPNGAGKTTLLSMAVGLLRPDSGSSEVLGIDMWKEPRKAKSLVGVLPDGLSIPERLTGVELLTHVGHLRGIGSGDLSRRVEDLIELMGLASAHRTLVIDYSAGMRKKIGLALALLHAPSLLVLDEPFEAVDPVSASTLKTLLIRYVTSGGTVLLSSHVMALVEQLCDRVAVMADGVVVADGKLDEVRGDQVLEERFVDLVGGSGDLKGLSWLLP